jgi:hypothetical protein
MVRTSTTKKQPALHERLLEGLTVKSRANGSVHTVKAQGKRMRPQLKTRISSRERREERHPETRIQELARWRDGRHRGRGVSRRTSLRRITTEQASPPSRRR